jgi:hypothetical protein
MRSLISHDGGSSVPPSDEARHTDWSVIHIPFDPRGSKAFICPIRPAKPGHELAVDGLEDERAKRPGRWRRPNMVPYGISDVFIERPRGLAQLGDNPRVGPADHAAVTIPRNIPLPLISPDRHDHGNDDNESDKRRQANPQPSPSELGPKSAADIMR